MSIPRLQSIRCLAATLTTSTWAQTPSAQIGEDDIISIDQLQVKGLTQLMPASLVVLLPMELKVLLVRLKGISLVMEQLLWGRSF